MKIRLGEMIRKKIRKKENILIEFLSVFFWVIIGIVAVFLYSLGVLDLLTLLQVIFGLILAFLPLYLYLITKREQTMLIGLASIYFLEKEESKIDELLGILIAGKWEKLKIDPIDEFFKCIKGICLKSDFEMRRRISEALPALFKIDLEDSKDLVEILRRDWDEKWKSDNRRRTIEALPYIISKDKKFVRDNLHVIDGDEIFTIIAMVEVLAVWREKVNKKEAEKIYTELKNEVEECRYGKDEINAISELWSLLHLIHSDVNRAITKFEELKVSPNIYIQICVARNLKHLYKRFSEIMLKFMAYSTEEGRDRNVRRPVANRESLECLITLLMDRRFSEKAKGIIWRLINDNDDLVRLTTFDKIEKILEIDNEFGNKILQHIIKNDRHSKLVERAKTLISRYEN